MGDLIDRNDALNIKASFGVISDDYILCIPLKDVKKHILSLPKKDVCDVVRCKDCKHRPYPTEEGKNIGFSVTAPDDDCPFVCCDGWYTRIPEDDFYCAYGERGENNDG